MNQLPLYRLAELAMLLMVQLNEAAPSEDEGQPPLGCLVREMDTNQLASLSRSHHARQPLWWQHWQKMQNLAQPGDSFWFYRNPADRSTGVALLRGGCIVEWIPLSTW